MADGDIIHGLQLELASLQSRLKELESDNLRLASRLSNCCCYKVEGNTHENVGNGVVPVDPSKKLKHGGCKSSKKNFEGQTMHNHSKRYVALKIMYFGKRFYGFASEAHMEPTIESELFKALEKTRLLTSDRKESQYSRCGRTDKGVSAVGQVVALNLRSKLQGGSKDPTNSSEGEIDYVRVLNRVLPKDIRVIGWCPAPVDLHARFSCLSREYKYFFWRENLDLAEMKNAGKKFLGEHDFRNFCKMDAVNVHNYKRCVTSFEISLAERFGCKELWAIKIKGSAFLWHQIRCMVSVLFMIGHHLETTDVIDALLDIERTPRKPQYSMASEAPLVLHSCEFCDLNFSISPDAREALHVHLDNEWQNHLMEAAIFHEALRSSSPIEGETPPKEPSARKKPLHIPLKTRVTEPSYEERRGKLNSGRLKQGCSKREAGSRLNDRQSNAFRVPPWTETDRLVVCCTSSLASQPPNK